MSTRGTAVIIGAGIAGLTAARVLADRFATVTVLDRDTLLDDPGPRRGVPQSQHGHVLLKAGQNALEEMFPGLQAELTAAGAVPFDPGLDLLTYRLDRYWPLVDLRLGLISFSRGLLELTIRRRVSALSAVTVRDEVAAAGLLGSADQITGVVLDTGEELPADLVVDCSGRGARSDRWLDALGCATPAGSEVKVGIGYSTRLLRRRPGDLEAAAAFIVPEAPHQKRAGLVLPIEGDRWLVSLAGWHGDFPDGSEESFVDHAKRLPVPLVADLIATAEPLTDIVSQQFPSSRRRHFEALRRPPAGYLATGDAVCSFNPIHGQGMTCATLQAQALGRLLDGHASASAEFAREFYREVNRIITTPWLFATGADFNYPETTGPRPRGGKITNWYARKIADASMVSPEVRRIFLSVQQLVLPPSVLFRPTTVVKVLRTARRLPPT